MFEKTALRRKAVKSSNIRSIGYDRLRKKLEVEFSSGEIYRYQHVPSKVVHDFTHAASKGKFFNSEIKYSYPYRRYMSKNREKLPGTWRMLEKKPKKVTPVSLEKAAAINADVNLYPHQKRVVDDQASSKIIAHGVGSGKTLTAIAKFENLKDSGRAKKALVVVPAGLRENFGSAGVGRFTKSKYNIIGNSMERQKKLYGTVDPEADYNIISYEMFRARPEEYLTASGADTVIFDEVHRTKNEDTATTQVLQRVRPLYKNHIGLTGSLVSNSVADLQPLVRAASGGSDNLGKTKQEFLNKWVIRDDNRKYKGLPESRIPIKGFQHEKMLGQELKKYIDYVDPEELRRAADMPTKKVNLVKVPLTHEQAKIYRKLLNDDKKVRQLIKMRRLETVKTDTAAMAFNKLTEARKLMNDIGAAKPGMSLAESASKSPKTKRLLDDLEQHLMSTPDGQAIVLSNLVRGGTDVVSAGLDDRMIHHGKFLGKGVPGITEASRQSDVNDFKSRHKRAIVISPAGGEGLSLNNTTWEGVLDPHFNPERMNQMEARGIRAGGLKGRPDRTIQVNRYLSTMPRTLGIFKSNLRTPDEFIYEISRKKDEQNQKVYDLLKHSQ